MSIPKYTDYKTSDAYYEACCEYAIMGGRTGNEDCEGYYHDDYYDDGYEEDEYKRDEENKWGCDNICQCNILGWNLIIKKNEVAEGDKMVYIEIDFLLPSDNPHFAFLEKKKFKIKTMKMKGVITQGIAFPLSILPEGKYSEGDDVTELLKIKKIEDETPEIRPSDPLKYSKSKFLKTRFAKWLMCFKPMQKLLLRLFVPKTKKYNYPLFVVRRMRSAYRIVRGC